MGLLSIFSDTEGDSSDPKREKYTKDVSEVLIIMYFCMIVIWLLFAMILGVKPNDIVTVILLMLPVFIFSIAIYNAYNFDKGQHISKAAINLFTVALLSTSIIVNWKRTTGNPVEKNKFYKMLIAGFILAMVSAVDFWMDRDDEVYVIHFKSAAQTMSLTIIMIALYWYYVDVTK